MRTAPWEVPVWALSGIKRNQGRSWPATNHLASPKPPLLGHTRHNPHSLAGEYHHAPFVSPHSDSQYL